MIKIVPSDNLLVVLKEKRMKYLVLGESNYATFANAKSIAQGQDDRMAVWVKTSAFKQFSVLFPRLDPHSLVSISLCENNKIMGAFHVQQTISEILSAYEDAAIQY